MIPDCDPAENELLIVTGSTPCAEKYDRPLAYRLQRAVCRQAETDENPLSALVLSDLWYLNYEQLQALPVISVGGPGNNALAARFYRRLAPALVIDSALMIQVDRKPGAPRASIWGAYEQLTNDALQIFTRNGHLREFLDLIADADRVPY